MPIIHLGRGLKWKQGLTYDGVGFYHKPNSLLELENPMPSLELENPTLSLMIGN